MLDKYATAADDWTILTPYAYDAADLTTPESGESYLQITYSKGYKFQIADATGKVIYTDDKLYTASNTSGNAVKFDVADVPAGEYVAVTKTNADEGTNEHYTLTAAPGEVTVDFANVASGINTDTGIMTLVPAVQVKVNSIAEMAVAATYTYPAIGDGTTAVDFTLDASGKWIAAGATLKVKEHNDNRATGNRVIVTAAGETSLKKIGTLSTGATVSAELEYELSGDKLLTFSREKLISSLDAVVDTFTVTNSTGTIVVSTAGTATEARRDGNWKLIKLNADGNESPRADEVPVTTPNAKVELLTKWNF